MEKIAVTRFDEQTWIQHSIWKNSRQYSGSIYNTPTKISPKIMPNNILFVIEMNNSLNKIEGIGLIKNHLNLQKKIKIYKEDNYNRFTYKSKYRIGKQDLSHEENKIIEVLEILLFKGSRHMKRGQGIQLISDWIQYNKSFDFNKFIKNLFIKKYKETENNIF